MNTLTSDLSSGFSRGPFGRPPIDTEIVRKQLHPGNYLIECISMRGSNQELLSDGVPANMHFLTRKLASCSKHVQSAVVIDPGIMHGNPVFQGTRIPIFQIIEELADGTKLEDLPEAFPSLNMKSIQGGLDFAAALLQIYDD